MGQTRIQTIANAIRTPEQSDALLEAYREKRLAKLEKQAQLSQDDFVNASKSVDGFLRRQFALGVALGKPEYLSTLTDKSDLGRAHASEDLSELHFCAGELKLTATFQERVKLLAHILFRKTGRSEPLVKEAVVGILGDLYRSFDAEHRDECFGRPLAVAIGLQYTGTAEDQLHREQVSGFADAHFTAKPQWLVAESGRESHDELARVVKEMLTESKRGETAILLKECRRSALP